MSIDAIVSYEACFEVCFLDFDGVLNNRQTFTRGHTEPFNGRTVASLDPENTSAFAAWLKTRPDMKIVVSSTWRVFHEFDDLVRLLKKHGVPAGTVVGRTAGYVESEAADWRSAERGLEIAHWLRLHEKRHGLYPEIVILDDLWASEFGPLARHLVQVNPDTGFLPDIAASVTKRLTEAPFDPARSLRGIR